MRWGGTGWDDDAAVLRTIVRATTDRWALTHRRHVDLRRQASAVCPGH